MKSVLIAFLLSIAASYAAILPIDSSSVNVKRAGPDYSYTIQENHGVAIDAQPVQIPIIKTSPVENTVSSIHLQQEQIQDEKQQPQVKSIPVVQPGTYSVPIAAIPAYVSSYHYGIPYGLNYQYGLVGVA